MFDPSDPSGFTSLISDKDRIRMHRIIRKVHIAHYPTEMITDYECDKILDAWGPKIAAMEIKKHMDAGDID